MPTIIADTTDGYLDKSAYSWAGARDAASADIAYVWQNDAHASVWHMPAPHDTVRNISRCFFAFDTSGINSIPPSATLNLHGINNENANIIVVKATAPDLTTGIALADFDAIDGFVAGATMAGNVTDYSAAFSAGSWNMSGYNIITLNAAALSDMAALFKIAIVEYTHDYLNVAPGGTTLYKTNWYTANNASNKPYIDYVPGPPWDYFEEDAYETQSSAPHEPNFDSNKYKKLSEEYTRTTRQVPFSKGIKGPANLRGNTAYTATKG